MISRAKKVQEKIVQHDASSLRSNDEILAVKGYLSSVVCRSSSRTRSPRC